MKFGFVDMLAFFGLAARLRSFGARAWTACQGVAMGERSCMVSSLPDGRSTSDSK